jgi:hypothetical protein
MIAEDQLGLGVDGQPAPLLDIAAAQRCDPLIQLQSGGVRSRSSAEVVEPTGDGLVVDTEKVGDVSG